MQTIACRARWLPAPYNAHYRIVRSRRRFQTASRCYAASRPDPRNASEGPEPHRITPVERGKHDEAFVPTTSSSSGVPLPSEVAAQGVPQTERPITERRGEHSTSRNGSRTASERALLQGCPPPKVPEWFLQRNVKLWEQQQRFFDDHTLALPQRLKERVRSLKRKAETSSQENERAKEAEPSPTTKAPEEAESFRYGFDEWVEREVLATLAACLGIVGREAEDSWTAAKSHVLLQCPVSGGLRHMEDLAERVAWQLKADVVTLDPADLAQIVGDYVGESPKVFNRLPVRNLSFDTYRDLTHARVTDRGAMQDEAEDVDEFESPEEPPHGPRGQGIDFSKLGIKLTRIPITIGISDMIPFRAAPENQNSEEGDASQQPGFGWKPMTPNAGKRDSLKMVIMLQALLESPAFRRKDDSANARLQPKGEPATVEDDGSTARSFSFRFDSPRLKEMLSHLATGDDPRTATVHNHTDTVSLARSVQISGADAARRMLVLIKDFNELRSTPNGNNILRKLQEIVQTKRAEGTAITLVGLSASEDVLSERKMPVIHDVQASESESAYRTIVTPVAKIWINEESPGNEAIASPELRGEDQPSNEEMERRHIKGIFPPLENTSLSNLEHHRIYNINIRNIQSLAQRLSRRLGKGLGHSDYFDLPYHLTKDTDLMYKVLTFDQTHRLVLLATGFRAIGNQQDSKSDKGRFFATSNKRPLEVSHVARALECLIRSEYAKMTWAENPIHWADEPNHVETTEASTEAHPRPAAFSKTRYSATETDSRMKAIRRTGNTYEKRLLSGVVNPQQIRTTFSDVHVAPTTIEALRTLTSLSLMRPEAFSYGVLATDKLTGLLLYGPPGTGKTLLAKAVAKESGATVLEVSGSDIYDMYVGEGEKNVRAIFSLAQKLTPCVVFIDEADAIFGSRNSFTNRNAHREIINQFLREWDGMTDHSVFIMVATNRPFDLDDAVLRRLPRRLLVDLPTETDRAAILAIHLKDEQLDNSISLPTLASQTPLYSGSDLKNLCVAAALACVREENDALQTAKSSDGSTASSPSPSPPSKRILHERHFTKALEEISASISEDMSSLAAMKKFDEKYGDRRGRRKKTALGFGGAAALGLDEAAAVEESSARVRGP